MTEHNTKITISCDKDNISKLTDVLSQHFDTNFSIEIKSKPENKQNKSNDKLSELTRDIILEYLEQHDMNMFNVNKNVIYSAAREGRLDVIKWFHFNIKWMNDIFTANTIDYAAGNGHLNIVIWLHENRKEGCTKYAMNLASLNGHLNVVKWLHENRTEGCTHHAIDWAAEHSHLDVVKWLCENRTEGYSAKAISNIVSRYGKIDTVLYLENKKDLLKN